MANTRTESHIPRGVTVLLVAAGDHRIRLLELLQPDDGIEIDVIELGPSASAAVIAQQHGLYLIDETASSDLELLLHAKDDGRPDTLAHLFEPFFTTKSRGQGTGLGLATVYGIVKQSGGYVWASSAIGAGSSFELLFPESTAASAVPYEEHGAQPAPEAEPTTVLVVDDDRAVRALIVRTLECEGFTVVQASSTTEAIQRFSPSVAMLVTDIVMPNMSGVTLALTLLARRPDLKVLLMSGYTPDALDQYGSLPGSGEVLAKPFSPDMLLGRVLDALGRHTG